MKVRASNQNGMEVIEAGVYFLFKGEKLVYIGKSNSIYNRIGQHVVSDKDFDSWEYYECEGWNELDISQLESWLIREFSPPYNKTNITEEKILLNKKQYLQAIRGSISEFKTTFGLKPRNNEKIIHCKDCKHYGWETYTEPRKVGRDWIRRAVCPFSQNEHIKSYDFCSRAEKGDNFGGFPWDGMED